MAFDGIVIANLANELNAKLAGGRITKVAQPEKDELLLTIKNNKNQYRLFLSAGASLPLIYLTETNKPSPLTAPNFCMLLRKHFNSARIRSITQPEMERILKIKIEHLNDLGDPCVKYLMAEIMGKHSNIILCDDSYQIIDSIKHIPAFVSSVREVLPGREYFIPKTQDKQNPLLVSQTQFPQSSPQDLSREKMQDFSRDFSRDFSHTLSAKSLPLFKAIYTSFTGISPLMANEICCRASLDAGIPYEDLSDIEATHLFHIFCAMMDDIANCRFCPNIIYKEEEPVEFSSFPLSLYENGGYTVREFDSISQVLEQFYAMKNTVTRIRQKSSDLRRIVSTAIERTSKKYDLQLKQLKDTDKRDKYKVYGELLTTYGYQSQPGDRSLTCENFYTGETITIPLDPTLSALDNAKKYFDKYARSKRTFEALTLQTKESLEELKHLESIHNALDIAMEEKDLAEIKKELTDYSYIRKHGPRVKEKKRKETSQPFHYRSSDGFDIYVGKNNYQNDALTFKLATGNDWWFHAKGMAGSHVIVKCDGKELPDRAFEEAGMLAAYYSKGRTMDKVEIDYIQKKHIKKPNGAKPGFVIYHTNYSMTISPDIRGIEKIEE